MLRKLGLLCAALALFSIAGGHWTVLQTAAWVGMLHDYSQRSGSIAVAVEQTLDGQHPCDLCRAIAAAKSQEHKDSPVAPGSKEEAKAKAWVADTHLPPLQRTVEEILFSRIASPAVASRNEQPPTPPPRRWLIAV